MLTDQEIAKSDHSTKPERKKTKNAVKMHQFLSQDLAKMLSDQYLAKADHAANKESLE